MEGFPEFSPTIGAIAAALAAAQGEIKDAAKDAVNPHFKNRYSTLASVRAAVTPAFSKNGLAVTQYFEPHGAEGVMIVTLLMHSSGEWIRSRLYLPVSKKDPQGFGSAISYGRRYQLASIANIASDEDDDAEAASKTPKVATPPPAAASSVDVTALLMELETAENAEQLAAASLAVGQVKDKLSKADLQKCRATHDATLRRLGKEVAA